MITNQYRRDGAGYVDQTIDDIKAIVTEIEATLGWPDGDLFDA